MAPLSSRKRESVSYPQGNFEKKSSVDNYEAVLEPDEDGVDAVLAGVELATGVLVAESEEVELEASLAEELAAAEPSAELLVDVVLACDEPRLSVA